jgi:hypothetical protein
MAFAAALAMSAALCAADNTLGTWKLNLEKSKYDPGPPPVKSVTLVREAAPGGGAKMTVSGVRADGTAIKGNSTAKYDGKDYPVMGNPNYDSVAVTQVDANNHAAVYKKSGKTYSNAKIVISEDGKTMTVTSTGTNAAGRPFRNVAVYEKQ